MVSHTRTGNTIVFYDPQYPQLCSRATLDQLVPGPFQLVDAGNLGEFLHGEGELLISFHGPYFPKAAWSSVLRFLEAGGNLAIFGGMPFARPVDSEGSIEPEQDAYTRQLFLGPFFQVAATAGALQFVADEDAAFLRDCPLALSAAAPGSFWSFYPKLTQTNDHPEDTGSAGPFDTTHLPLIYALAPTATGQQRAATPASVLDQHSGRFRGGRWLISPWQPSSEESWLANAEALQRLIRYAAQGATTTFDVRPGLACYQPGEAPALVATVRTRAEMQARVVLYQPGGDDLLQTFELTFPPSPVQQEQQLRLPAQQQPGLYRVEAEYRVSGGQPFTARSGFWIWDEALVEATRNQRLMAGRDYFYQDNQLFLVFGTTYMDSRVQRKFLHLPNPGRWDRDMAEMRASGVNLIRTGLWTAWREFAPVAGSANEAFLRALDAFVMTVCRYNIQLIFTFFSFFPMPFEGENPWLDPRSIEGQRDFVGLLARRYARVELVSWDLINEPSFGDPKRIFMPRPIPNYDRFEVAAFQSWLRGRYTLSELQLRWRQTPAEIPTWELVLPPDEADYDTYVRSTTTRLSLKVADYTHFSQEMFNNWTTQMTGAIRASGSQTLIGVGQDEAGTRISPQFYAPVVDYTTTHPWWNIDDLLWDMLIDKTLEKPNLIQETGVMLARDIDGRPWRSEQENAHLLERKLVTGLIARGAGLIQWLWHANAYMTSDNENSIGLLRTDGSAKPELLVMQEFGRLTSALAGRLVEAPSTPDVWLVIPYSQWFTRPEAARQGTQRAARVLGYNLGIIPQMIGEHQLGALATVEQRPRAIIIPAAQLLNVQAWKSLLSYVHAGGTLLVNGVIGRDQHNLPFAPEIAGIPDEQQLVPVSFYEELVDREGQTWQVTFAHEATNYVKKAHNQVCSYPHGAGTLIWCGLPLELANETPALSALYRRALQQDPAEDEEQINEPFLITRRPLKSGSLILVVSESSSEQRIRLDEEDLEITIEPNRAGALILGSDRTAQVFGGLQVQTREA